MSKILRGDLVSLDDEGKAVPYSPYAKESKPIGVAVGFGEDGGTIVEIAPGETKYFEVAPESELAESEKPSPHPGVFVDGKILFVGDRVYLRKANWNHIPLEVVEIKNKYSIICKAADGWNIKGKRSETHNAYVRDVKASSLSTEEGKAW